ncbi:hypothetical protein N8955_00880 [bacterium]|nr:hypothetical protein [Hellea sp.]MDA7807266.1 hypothetical protein [bacterium]MDA9047778.1 hypothetical protein [Hellea sp.]MDA9225326.1 hypothetical protein [bacterium]
MSKNESRDRAFKESIQDTMLALIINFPLNMLLLFIANRTFLLVLESEGDRIFWTSVFLTFFFTIFAVIRKTYVRMYFERKNLKHDLQQSHNKST